MGNSSVINTSTNAVIATITVGDSPTGIAVSPNGAMAYVTNYLSNTVSVINTMTNTVISTIGVGVKPQGVVVHPDGTKVYVTNSTSTNVKVINTANNATLATIPVGGSPLGIATNFTGSIIYVCNSNSDNVSVINAATNSVVATIGVGDAPLGFGNFISPGFLPSCTSLSSPVNGQSGVAVSSQISWNPNSGPLAGYKLSAGTTPGGTDILNNFDVGNVLTYDPPGNFPYGSTIYVKIIPYNANGDATGCTEESFTTEGCLPNLVIATIPIPEGTYMSLGDLTAHNATVANLSIVIFTSDTGILLEHDFEVELGAVFDAYIQGCPTNLVPVPVLGKK